MEWADELGFSREEAYRIAGPFGGGMFRGDTCGTVAAAMIAIGMKYGGYEPGDAAGNALMTSKVEEFQKEFVAKNGSLLCRELVGYDFSKKGEFDTAFGNGRIFEVCPGFVQSSLEILSRILAD